MSTLELKEIQAPSGFDLQMPAGHIVDVTTVQMSSSMSTSSSSFTDVMTATVTPKNASNKFIIQVVMRWQESTSVDHFKAQIYDKTNSSLIGGSGNYGQYNSGSANVIGVWPFTTITNATNTTAREYAFQAATSGTLHINVNDYWSTLVIWEIQG
jgi:hypothetical protein|tara:strand:- start:565 stop:1029 length:465 start_codon:yes stop_codon:yes gene_type:complete